ncbi:MAG: Ig-like domain-containing protein [Gemmatimonadaceae bacterium]
MRMSRLIAGLVFAGAAGCGAKTTTAANMAENCGNSLQTAIVSPLSVTLNVGDTLRFSASMPGCTPAPQFRWSSSSPAVVSVDSLTGLATAHAVGTVAVTAVPTFDRTIVGASTVRVVQ